MYPILSDFWPHGEVAEKFGILTDSGFADRVVLVIDRKGIIRYREEVGVKNVPDNEKTFAFLNSLE